ncbi:uncharacterized protein LOC123011489 [Tribolium madens]|uniref:uncharacterized protein LOC123011489 n=1 Tax=Tribolium madens TaxID=41895 RepID=UPI001CF731A1|nr:uncharacterized protein LOC123011489 [Tribolium madens]
MASLTKILLFILSSCYILSVALANAPISRSSRRIHIPFLGLGPRCTGCPPHYCDDDPAIIHGYCCGCARFFDVLPVKCGAFVDCPLNTYDLCEDYEYMMYCCCE